MKHIMLLLLKKHQFIFKFYLIAEKYDRYDKLNINSLNYYRQIVKESTPEELLERNRLFLN